MAVQSELTVKVDDNLDEVNRNLAKTSQAYKSVENQAARANAQLIAAQQAMERQATTARNAVLAIAAAMGTAAKAYADFDTAATNVQNITEKSASEMDALREAVLQLPPELGEATDLMGALYQTLSSGVPDDNAIEFLELHAKAAQGNLADLSTTVKSGAAIMNAYSLDISEMGQVLDSMTKTVDLGVLSYSDLSENIGKGISIAQSAGASYQELMAILATLTLNGMSVEESMTSVRNIMLASLKPTSEMAKAASELGADLSATKLESEGFAKWMGDIALAVDGNAEATAKLFPNIRALNGAMKLASEEGGAKYNEILNEIENSTGKAGENFERMSETLEANTRAMIADFKKLGIEMGAVMADDMQEIVAGIRDMIEAFRGLSPQTKEFIVDLGKAGLALGAFVLVAPKVIGAYTALTALIKGAAAAQGLQIAASKAQAAQWKADIAAMAAHRAAMAANTAATTGASTATAGLTVQLRASQAAMAQQRAAAAAAAASTASMGAAAQAAQLKMIGLTAALAAAYVAGLALEKWFDSMNQLTPEFTASLNDAVAAEREFATAVAETGTSAAQLIKRFGSLEAAMKEAAKPLSEFHDAYMALQKDTQEQLIAEEFERIIKSANAWEELAAGWESIDNMVRAGKEGVGALGTAYDAAVKSVKMMQEQEKKLAQIEKDKADLQKKIAAAEKKYRADTITGIKSQIKEASKAHKLAMEEIRRRNEARREAIELYYAEQEALQQQYEDLEQLFTTAGKVEAGVLSVFEGIEQAAKDAISQTQSYINSNPLMLEVIPPGPTELAQISGEILNALDPLFSGFSATIADALYDGIQGNLPSMRQVFQGFSADIGDYLYSSLSESINSAFGEASEAMRGGAEGEGAGGFAEGVGAFFGSLDEDFWLDAGAGIATAFMGKSQQEADKVGAAIAGGISGAMIGTKILPGIGTAIGFVIGAIVGYFGASKQDTPKARARVGYFGGEWSAELETKKAQTYTEEMARTFGQQQAAIFDSFKSAYRKILESFGDATLLEGFTLENLPGFGDGLGLQFQEWVESSAADLGSYLEQTYWPEAFREYFRAALETGLGQLGVSDLSIGALFAELERLPGEQTMQALADFVQAVVSSTELLSDLDWGEVWADVVQSPRQAMAELGQQIADQIQVWSTGWEALTGVEQARQLIQITDLITQARQNEIQYLQQINQLQQTLWRSISQQIEGLEMGGMTEQQQIESIWGRLQWIFGQLEQGGLSAQDVNQLTSDAQNYIRQLEGLLGENLGDYVGGYFADFGAGFLPEDMFEAFEGGSVRQGLIDLLTNLRDASQAATQEMIDESRERIAAYNEQLQSATDSLLNFGAVLDEIVSGYRDRRTGGSGGSGPLDPFVRDRNVSDPITGEEGPPTTTLFGQAGTYQGAVAGVMEGIATSVSTTAASTEQTATAVQTMTDQLPDMIASAVERVIERIAPPVVVNKIMGDAAPLITAIKAEVIADLMSAEMPGGLE